MKKLFLIIFLLNSLCLASYKLKVEAVDDFESINPSEYFRVKIVEDSYLDSTPIIKNDILKCEITEITGPKRAKRDAKIYCILKSYEDSLGEHPFSESYIAKYAKTTLAENKGKIIKRTATTVGGIFVKGLSFGVSFIEGVKDNEEDNRIKSGFKKMYDDSLFSYVKYGEEVSIKKGDRFYFIIKKDDDDEDDDGKEEEIVE